MMYTKKVLDLCDDAVIKVSSTIIKDIMIHIHLPRERIGKSIEKKTIIFLHLPSSLTEIKNDVFE